MKTFSNTRQWIRTFALLAVCLSFSSQARAQDEAGTPPEADSSAAVDRSGSVFADLEVPDFARSALTLSAIALGAPPADSSPRPDVLAGLLPIVPTSSRDFAASEHVSAFFRIFQGEPAAPVAVDVTVEILDVHDVSVFKAADQFAPGAFDAHRSASHRFDLPLERLTQGPYLLTITARTGSGRVVRRDLVFSVR